MEKERNATGDFLSSMRSNPWMVSTFVLGILFLGALFFAAGLPSFGATAKAEKLVDFLNTQTPNGGVSLKQVDTEGDLLKVTVEYNNELIPLYMTKDGKNFLPQVRPLDGSAPAQPAAAAQQDVPKNDKPVVDVFVMSLCPYGTQIEKGLLPVVSLLKDKIDFKVRWVDYTLHGPVEADENTLQYCLQKEQSAKFLPYLQCFLDNKGVAGGTPGARTSADCQASTGIDRTRLQSCITKATTDFSISNANYQPGQAYPVDTADNDKYGVQGSPTVVINGVQVQTNRDPASLLATVCSAFENAPAECSMELPSDTPAPGFSFSASASESAAAACAF